MTNKLTTNKNKIMENNFKKGDKVTFMCADILTNGNVEEAIGNDIYRVNCNGMFVAVHGSTMTLEGDVTAPKVTTGYVNIAEEPVPDEEVKDEPIADEPQINMEQEDTEPYYKRGRKPYKR